MIDPQIEIGQELLHKLPLQLSSKKRHDYNLEIIQMCTSLTDKSKRKFSSTMEFFIDIDSNKIQQDF